jgi:hypothetical protein
MDLSSPRLNGLRAPMPMKPIAFWLRDLTDGSGDITNPTDLFGRIRAMMRDALTQMSMASSEKPAA